MKKVRLIPTWGAAALILAVVGAAPAAAQDEPPPDRERITQYARAHIVLNQLRDEFHGKVGRIHDEQGRERARQEMEEQVEAALDEHGLTREEYDALTLLISMDGEVRAVFDEVMEEIETGDG